MAPSALPPPAEAVPVPVGRVWGPLSAPLQPAERTGRLGEVVGRAELAGLAFAFRARLLATAIVALAVVSLISPPRNGWYFGLALAFSGLGAVPYALRHGRLAEPVKLAFVVLDVALLTVAILVPPPDGISIDWPVQTRLRGQTFLFLLLLLGEAALTYSPRRVMWTGASIAVLWSVGFAIVNGLPTTLRYTDVVGSGSLTDAELLRMYVDPSYVSPASFIDQLIATALFTLLLTLAVVRSRSHLVAETRADAVRADLARHVSPDVADAVADRVSSGFGEPATREVAVLFADVVGFTSLSETLQPDCTFALLRSFQERSARVVLDHGGTLDKYLGDGLMATFGALTETGDAAKRAVACAFALDAEMARWNGKRQARGAKPIRLAVGVHHGPAMVGLLGSERRIEFTVVGDVVNVASRLEKANRELGCRLVVSDACRRAAGPEAGRARFDRTVEVPLRGRREPILVHLHGGDAAAGNGKDPGRAASTARTTPDDATGCEP